MTVTRLAKGKYRVRVVVNGEDIRRTAPSKELADKYNAALEAQRFSLAVGLPQDRRQITFEDYFKTWLAAFKNGAGVNRRPRAKTVQNIEELKPRLEAFNPLWLDQITREQLEGACAKIAATHPDRAYKVCALVKRVLRAAQGEYAVDERVFRARMAKPRPRQQIALSWPEVELIASECPDHIQRGVLFLALTGLRVGEFCALTDADVYLARRASEAQQVVVDEREGRSQGEAAPVQVPSFQAGVSRAETQASFVLVRHSKTQAGERRVYLCSRAAVLVREQMLARPNPGPAEGVRVGRSGSESSRKVGGARLLFPTSAGTPYNKDTFRRVLQRAADRAGIEGVHPHSLRSSFVTLCAQAGMPFDVVKEQAGWSDSQAARVWPIYRKVAGWETSRAVQLLDSFIGGEVQEAREA